MNGLRIGTSVLLVAVLSFIPALAFCEEDEKDNSSAQQIFDQRIMPIFRSPEPSSCIQCHLASVDLKNYILPSQEKTFVSLRDQGLIDLDDPTKSKILHLIEMGEKDQDEGAKLIHDSMRKAEYEAFTLWIKACAENPDIRNLPSLNPVELAKPSKPDEVIRHARKSRLVDSFERNIWSQRMRCFPCHTPNEIKPNVRGYQGAIKTVTKMKEDYTAEHFERLQFFKETPEATMQFWIERSQDPLDDELPMLNLADPIKSLIVLKPTSKIPKKLEDGSFENPSSLEPTSHMGGLKMHGNDQSYKSFIAWVQDYASVVGEEYTSVADLPADNWFASNRVIRLTQAPDNWRVGSTVQIFVHKWDPGANEWREQPAAFTQGTVTPRKIVNGMLFLFANESNRNLTKDPTKTTLPPGRYLIKAYLDKDEKLSMDPAILLGDEEFVGQTVLEKARWNPGFPKAEKVSAKKLQNDDK